LVIIRTTGARHRRGQHLLERLRGRDERDPDRQRDDRHAGEQHGVGDEAAERRAVEHR
jgi:hypothetical protein